MLVGEFVADSGSDVDSVWVSASEFFQEKVAKVFVLAKTLSRVGLRQRAVCLRFPACGRRKDYLAPG